MSPKSGSIECVCVCVCGGVYFNIYTTKEREASSESGGVSDFLRRAIINIHVRDCDGIWVRV